MKHTTKATSLVILSSCLGVASSGLAQEAGEARPAQTMQQPAQTMQPSAQPAHQTEGARGGVQQRNGASVQRARQDIVEDKPQAFSKRQAEAVRR